MPLRQWEEIQKLLWVIQEIKILKVYFYKYLMAVILEALIIRNG